jgi:hypothetical protein
VHQLVVHESSCLDWTVNLIPWIGCFASVIIAWDRRPSLIYELSRILRRVLLRRYRDSRQSTSKPTLSTPLSFLGYVSSTSTTLHGYRELFGSSWRRWVSSDFLKGEVIEETEVWTSHMKEEGRKEGSYSIREYREPWTQ